MPNFRVRTIPVLGTLPAMFGMAAATSIICTLAGRPFEPDRPLQLTTKQYERQLSRLEEREYERFGTRGGVAVDLDEVRRFGPRPASAPWSRAQDGTAGQAGRMP